LSERTEAIPVLKDSMLESNEAGNLVSLSSLL
jgi:hypothetical protein